MQSGEEEWLLAYAQSSLPCEQSLSRPAAASGAIHASTKPPSSPFPDGNSGGGHHSDGDDHSGNVGGDTDAETADGAAAALLRDAEVTHAEIAYLFPNISLSTALAAWLLAKRRPELAVCHAAALLVAPHMYSRVASFPYLSSTPHRPPHRPSNLLSLQFPFLLPAFHQLNFAPADALLEQGLMLFPTLLAALVNRVHSARRPAAAATSTEGPAARFEDNAWQQRCAILSCFFYSLVSPLSAAASARAGLRCPLLNDLIRCLCHGAFSTRSCCELWQGMQHQQLSYPCPLSPQSRT